MRSKAVKTLIIIVITVIFIYFFIRSVDWREVVIYIGRVNLPLFLASIPLAALHFFTRGFRWKFLLFGEKASVRYWPLVAANIIGFTINFVFPGRLGEIAKPLYLARKEKIRTGFTIGTVVVERIFDMFAMCFMLGVFLLSRPLYINYFSLAADSQQRLTLWGAIGICFASVLLLFSLALYFFKEGALRIISKLIKPAPVLIREKIINLIREFIDGLKFFHSLRRLFTYIILSLAVWLGIIFFYWIFFLAYGVNLPFYLMVPYVFLTMVGASIPTPGMAGGFDYFSKVGLTSFYGVDPNLAVGMTLVTHALQVVVTCLLGYVILSKEGMSLISLKKFEARKES